MALIPAVLRDEKQFRLLFAGQALSLLGDRIGYIALPFAVLAVGALVILGGAGVVAMIVGFARRRPQESRRWP